MEGTCPIYCAKCPFNWMRTTVSPGFFIAWVWHCHKVELQALSHAKTSLESAATSVKNFKKLQYSVSSTLKCKKVFGKTAKWNSCWLQTGIQYIQKVETSQTLVLLVGYFISNKTDLFISIVKAYFWYILTFGCTGLMLEKSLSFLCASWGWHLVGVVVTKERQTAAILVGNSGNYRASSSKYRQGRDAKRGGAASGGIRKIMWKYEGCRYSRFCRNSRNVLN